MLLNFYWSMLWRIFFWLVFVEWAHISYNDVLSMPNSQSISMKKKNPLETNIFPFLEHLPLWPSYKYIVMETWFLWQLYCQALEAKSFLGLGSIPLKTL